MTSLSRNSKLYSRLTPREQQSIASRRAPQLGRVFASQAYIWQDAELHLLLDAARDISRRLDGIYLRSEALTRIIEIYSTRNEWDKLAPSARKPASS